MAEHTEMNRREFLKKGGLFTLTSGIMFYASHGAYGAPGVTEADVTGKYARLIPADKQLDAEWFKSLFTHGEAQVYTEPQALQYIGMPVGGLFAGTVYLGGDGRLWYWNIRNDDGEGVLRRRVDYKGRSLRMRDGPTMFCQQSEPIHLSRISPFVSMMSCARSMPKASRMCPSSDSIPLAK